MKILVSTKTNHNGEPKKTTGGIGEYKNKPQPKTKDQKGSEASRSKEKGNMVDNDDEEEEYLSEGAKLKRKKRDKELDEIECVAKQFEAREKEARDAHVTLETQKALFPPWSMEQILNEAIDN
ncbi:unnamed protein product [Lactuca saligna]|uniref:No apical meristem-associated C-terminal domain-containing protein n=1 Tax=Lactuca saligna TaxID=75948 RepID=A0AA35YV19_LACSI|nr:unnamed protein product [Lactuca saligna]